MLESLIQAHQDRPQYCTKFPDGTVVYFHLLSKSEYDALTSVKEAFGLDDDTFFEEVYNLCVSDEYKDIGGRVRAGIPRSIGEYIYYHSLNYDVIEEEIELARARYQPNELYEQMKFAVMTAFPNYKLEDLDKKDRPSLIKLFVRAESMLQLKTQGEYKPVNTKTLRKPAKDSKIDFDRENRELVREVGNAGQDDPWSRNGAAHNLLQIRESAARKQQARLEKVRNG